MKYVEAYANLSCCSFMRFLLYCISLYFL
jgi:hypothetical protein